MALDAYYHPSMDYFLLPPATPTTDHEFPYSAEEDLQLLLHLHGFLSDYDLIPPPSFSLSDTNTSNIYPHSSSYLYPNYQPQPPFLLDYDDHCSSFYQLPNCDNYFMPEPPPKRQKRFHPYSFNNYSDLLPPPPPQKCCACTPQAVNEGEGSNCFQMGRKATAQSISVRERRKRISNKTMELGKLVPGAESGKMNTAEMLQHAFKYVKFMQSQLSLLQLLSQEQIKIEGLEIVASSAVQEKLYMKGQCLVPLDLLDQLAADGDLQSQSPISTDLKQLMQSVSAYN